MQRLFLLLTYILCTSLCLAQTSFKQGYFIDLQGNKTECLVKDLDWRSSPNSFSYKLTASGSVEKKDTEQISEFKVGSIRYIRAKVKYDQSSQELSKLSIDNNPEWTDGDLLLKVVVDGKAALYHYNAKNYSLFFYSVGGNPIEQLVFKSYYSDPGRNQKLIEQKQYLHTNSTYLYQLNTKVKCSDNADATGKEVHYQLKPLADYFIKYNRCSGDAVAEIPKDAKVFSLRLTPGVTFASAKADQVYVRNYNYGSAKTFRMGVDLQFALPFNNGKWAVVAEPNYSSFSGSDTKKRSTFKYSYVELPIGVRHRFFLSGKSYIFVNGMVSFDFPADFTQTYPITAATSGVVVDKRTVINFTAGAGFAYDRFSIEGRYYPTRKTDYEFMTHTVTRSMVILGIRVF